MLILDVDGSRVKVAIYEAAQNEMIEYGWVDLGGCECWKGWTITKYDWEGFIKKKATND